MRPPPARSAATASRNSSTRVGCCQAKWVTRPVRSAAASTAWSSAPSASSSSVSPARSETTRTPGSPAAQCGRGVRDDDAQQPAGLPAAQLLDGAGGDHAAAGEDADRVAEPLDQVELVAGEDDRHALAALLEQRLGEGVDADRVEAGERLVEDEHLGRLTRAAASWTRCWLPRDSFSTASPRRSPRPSRSTHFCAARGRGRVQPVQPGEVGDLLADLHLG